jgi:hypothetical protein
MSGLARSIKGTHNVRAYRLPQIPATLEPKTGAELCCISSDNTALRKIHATDLDTHRERSHIQSEIPVEIRCMPLT